MSGYYRAATACTPEVKLDPGQDLLSIEGESYPDDCLAFYGPVIEALAELPPQQVLCGKFRMAYLDSTTSHFLSLVLEQLNKRHLTGAKILIEWFYGEDDDDIYECGQDYADELDLPFQFISY